MSLDFSPASLFDLEKTEHPALFTGLAQAWEIVPRLAEYLKAHLRPGYTGARLIGTPQIGAQVYLGAGTVVEPGAYIKGPAWIGENCEIRHGAYLRENVVIGAGSVIGNSSEIKNSFLFQGCQVPHFNYVGDSVLGARVHLAAGVILSNLKLNGEPISICSGDEKIETGLRKFGALVGEGTEIGCHAVLNPGSVLGRNSLVYPGVIWRGVLPENSIAKSAREVMARR